MPSQVANLSRRWDGVVLGTDIAGFISGCVFSTEPLERVRPLFLNSQRLFAGHLLQPLAHPQPVLPERKHHLTSPRSFLGGGHPSADPTPWASQAPRKLGQEAAKTRRPSRGRCVCWAGGAPEDLRGSPQERSPSDQQENHRNQVECQAGWVTALRPEASRYRRCPQVLKELPPPSPSYLLLQEHKWGLGVGKRGHWELKLKVNCSPLRPRGTLYGLVVCCVAEVVKVGWVGVPRRADDGCCP